jgi:hypothetical protein
MSCFTASETLYKQISETRRFSMNFAELMSDGEIINSSPAPVVTSETIDGGTSNLVITDVTIVGQTVEMLIAGGGPNRNRYRVEIVIHTSSGQILEVDGILVVGDK